MIGGYENHTDQILLVAYRIYLTTPPLFKSFYRSKSELPSWEEKRFWDCSKMGGKRKLAIFIAILPESNKVGTTFNISIQQFEAMLNHHRSLFSISKRENVGVSSSSFCPPFFRFCAGAHRDQPHVTRRASWEPTFFLSLSPTKGVWGVERVSAGREATPSFGGRGKRLSVYKPLACTAFTHRLLRNSCCPVRPWKASPRRKPDSWRDASAESTVSTILSSQLIRGSSVEVPERIIVCFW